MKPKICFGGILPNVLSLCTLVAAKPIDTCSSGTVVTVTSTYSAVRASSTSATSTSTTSTLPTATSGFSIAPKVLIVANTFEFGYLDAYNWTTQYTGSLFDQLFACTADAQICMLACGQELVSASQITALLLIPGIDLTKTYIIITGTGGVNPKHGTAGGAAISTFCVQWEWGGMFLGSDLPANFSSQYFYFYA